MIDMPIEREFVRSWIVCEETQPMGVRGAPLRTGDDAAAAHPRSRPCIEDPRKGDRVGDRQGGGFVGSPTRITGFGMRLSRCGVVSSPATCCSC